MFNNSLFLEKQLCFMPDNQECAACLNGECMMKAELYIECNKQFKCPYSPNGLCLHNEYDCANCSCYIFLSAGNI